MVAKKQSKPNAAESPDRKSGAPKPETRRSFLSKLWMILGSVIVIEYALLAADFLRPRKRAHDGPSEGLIEAGPVERFEPGSVTAFPAGRFYLARLEEGGFIALSRVCTHLGCTVPWDDESHSFVCPCHASSYDIRGCVVSPPAPRPLDVHPVRIENGIVKVDVRHRERRHAFETRHVTYA